jgi:uncharacterized protein with GYD domain
MEFYDELKGGTRMPSYMVQISYTAEVLASFIKKPTDRTEVISKLAAKIGGKLVGSWFSFGDYDAVIIIEGGDNVSAAAVSIAVSASGAFKGFKTTPLLGTEEGLAAMKKAGALGYKPPNAKKK